MNKVATTKLSSRGQVVIPEEIREQMHLHTGDQFVVMSENDVVILKVITKPNKNEFEQLIYKARQTANNLGLKETDIESVIKESREK